MADGFHIVVIGLPELGHLLGEAEPGGAAVVSLAAAPDVERALAARARGATRDRTLFVVALGPEPAVNRLPARLARGGCRTVVLAGLPGAEPTDPPEGAVVLAAPFSADDVLDALSRLPGDVPLLLPIDGGERLFGDGAGDEDADDEDADDDDDLLGPLVTPVPLRIAGAVAGVDDDDETEPQVEELPLAVGAPPLAVWPPADESVQVVATVGAVALDTPPWAHLPPPAPPPPPVDRPVPWADGAWPVPPVVPGAVLPAPGPGGTARRGRVVAVCSFKGGSGKCLTGDSLIVDPVTGVPHRLDEVVQAPDLATVLTLAGTRVECAAIAAKIDSGVKPTVRVDLASGRRVTVTPHHPFLLADGWRPAADVTVGEAVAVPARAPFPLCPVRLAGPDLAALTREIASGPEAMPEAAFRLPADQLGPLLDLLWPAGGDGPIELASERLARSAQHLLTRLAIPSRIAPAAAEPGGAWLLAVGAGPAAGPEDDDRAWDDVVAITPAGERHVWDLTVEPTHCFVADDVVVHNTTTALLAAATLARALEPAGRRVALVDANTAQSSIRTILQRPGRGSVLDLVRSDVDERVLAAALTPIPEAGGLDVLLGAPDLRSPERRLVTAALYRRIVAALRRTHDYVLVDTPVAEAVDHALFDDFVLRDADLLMVVVDPNRETIHNNVEWLDIIGDPVSAGGRNVAPDKIGVVLNRSDPDQAWNSRTVGDHFRRYQFLGAIPEARAIARAANDARLLARFDPAVDRATRSVLAALLAEPLVAPEAEPAPAGPVARLLSRVRTAAPGRGGR